MIKNRKGPPPSFRAMPKRKRLFAGGAPLWWWRPLTSGWECTEKIFKFCLLASPPTPNGNSGRDAKRHWLSSDTDCDAETSAAATLIDWLTNWSATTRRREKKGSLCTDYPLIHDCFVFLFLVWFMTSPLSVVSAGGEHNWVWLQAKPLSHCLSSAQWFVLPWAQHKYRLYNVHMHIPYIYNFSPRAQFLAQFFSTLKCVNRGKILFCKKTA